MTELSKMPGYKTQEAEDRGLQALANLPKMERAQFMEALKRKPAPQLEESTLAKSILKNRGLNVLPDEPTKYEEYTLPGGSNYREILMRMPHDPNRKVDPSSGHWDVPDVLAHVRAKDRTGPNGEKILHIEELQSDWHQQGRDKGYVLPSIVKQVEAAEIAHRKLKQQLDEAKQHSALSQGYLDDPAPFYQVPERRQRFEAGKLEANNKIMELMPQVMKAEAEHQDLLHKSKNAVPDAPFKKNWHEMALKKMIHHAAKNGYDSIAITPGAEQADRYGLAKHIGMMSYNPEDQHFQAFKPNRETAISERGATPERVSQLVGKELAQKLMAAPKQMGHHYIEGDDIKVGGEGMKGFYDKIVPNFLNQFGKKYGAKVAMNGYKLVTKEKSGQPTYNFRGEPSGEAVYPEESTQLHHFPITPEMREDVTKNGVPLYAEGGSVEGEEPKKTVKAYKLFRVHPKHPGKLFPLFVDANTPVEMDKWIDAKEGEMAKGKGKVKSKIGPLAYRPGWHAGDLPIATHIGEKSDPSLTAPDVRPDNHAWAEVEMPDDVDWQAEATKRGTNAQGRVIPVKAHITDQIPKGGHYRYKTNPNMTGNWLIGGSMKVNRVLTDKEVAKINKAAGLADLPRAQPFKGKKFGFAGGGTVAPDEWKAEAHVNHMADGGPVPPLRPLNPQLAAMREQMAQQSALHKAYDEAMKGVYTSQMPTFAQWVKSQGKAKGGVAHMAKKKNDYAFVKHKQGEKVGGYHVGEKINNYGSYESSGISKVLPGIHKVPMSSFETTHPNDLFYAKNDHDRVRHLAEQIKQNKYLDPLLVAMDEKGPYVLEGGHRLGAAHLLGMKEIPAMIGYEPEVEHLAPKAAGGAVKPIGYTKEQVTVSPNLDAMRYEMESVKRYTKKAK
jgi:hypothetical protein